MSKVTSFIKEHFLKGVTIINTYWFIDFFIQLTNKSATPMTAFVACVMGVVATIGWYSLYYFYENEKYEKRLAVIRSELNERK